MAEKKDKILVVEDEQDTKYILETLLKRSGYEIRTANNGLEALEVLQNFKPHVILADWTMPLMDGVELCDRLRKEEEYKSIYYIILTARGTLRDKIEGLDTGADDFLVKPTDNQELLARIRTGIRITKLQEELREAEHNKALVEMAFTAGHQINNPLASLSLSVENIKQELDEKEFAKIQDDIEIIEEAIKRIKNAADSLKNLQNPKLTDYASGKQMLDLDTEN